MDLELKIPSTVVVHLGAPTDSSAQNVTIPFVDYIKNVVKVVTDNLEDIDSRIVNALVNWKLDRVSKVNLTILRLAVGEMLFVDDVPGSVAINEAVELTKKYSDEKSTSFVNGVLDKVLKTLE